MGSTVELFLPDDNLYGFAKAHVKGQSTYLLSAARGQLRQLLLAEEANRRGIYFLVDTDQEQERFPVYVGQSGESVAERLKQHDKSKEFWTRCCSVTSNSPDFTSHHAKHLEQFFIAKVKDTGRAELTNKTSPAPTGLSEGDIHHIDAMIFQAKLILPMLRFDFLREVPEPKAQDMRFQIKYRPQHLQGVTIEATAYETDDEFVVTKGSQAIRVWHGQHDHHYKKLHAGLLADGILKPLDEHRAVFTRNMSFTKPSPAMAVIKGRPATGPKDWKVASGPLKGSSYEEWLKSKTAPIDPDLTP